MTQQQLFIPETLRVGYQNRSGTYNGKLAYIIYFDAKGVLRKQASWETWRDKKIASTDFKNEPTEGFVLNKGVGGQRESYGWNARNEYIRIFDPRGFEFEISVKNLLFILQETGCDPGKGLEGKFVYAWGGTDLILLPTSSQDYKNSSHFTELQAQGVKAKDLILGAHYMTKKQLVLTYLGRFDYFYTEEISNGGTPKSGVTKKYVFWNGLVDTTEIEEDFEEDERKAVKIAKIAMANYVFMTDLKGIAHLESDTVTENYAEVVDRYNKSIHGSRVVRLFLKQSKRPLISDYYGDHFWYREESDGVFGQYSTRFVYKKDEIESINRRNKLYLKDGVLIEEDWYGSYYTGAGGYGSRRSDSDMKSIEPTTLRLMAELESGSQFPVGAFNFHKDK